MSHEEISATFDRWAQEGTADGLEDCHGDVVRQVIAQLDLKPGMQSLELGCGTGWATRLLASAAPGAGAVGIDVSPEMIARAEDTHDLTSRARYELGRIEELDFPDGRFDRVFSMEVLYYVVDLQQALGEMLRVLKPGGSAHAVLDCFADSPHTASWSDSIGLEMHYLSEVRWRELFAEVGFVDVASQRVIDSRGPGDEESFEPGTHCPDWTTHVELHEAGSLWVRGTKPS